MTLGSASPTGRIWRPHRRRCVLWSQLGSIPRRWGSERVGPPGSVEKQHHGRGVVQSATFVGEVDQLARDDLGRLRFSKDLLDLIVGDKAADAVAAQQLAAVGQHGVGLVIGLERRWLADGE